LNKVVLMQVIEWLLVVGNLTFLVQSTAQPT
jgi:hypothetical protein